MGSRRKTKFSKSRNYSLPFQCRFIVDRLGTRLVLGESRVSRLLPCYRFQEGGKYESYCVRHRLYTHSRLSPVCTVDDKLITVRYKLAGELIMKMLVIRDRPIVFLYIGNKFLIPVAVATWEENGDIIYKGVSLGHRKFSWKATTNYLELLRRLMSLLDRSRYGIVVLWMILTCF